MGDVFWNLPCEGLVVPLGDGRTRLILCAEAGYGMVLRVIGDKV